MEVNKVSQLIDAARHDRTHIVEQLIAEGVDINASCNDDGYTALHMAVTWNRYATSKWLIDKGADINAITKDTSLTPLHQAVIRGDTQLLALLIDNGAFFNMTTKHFNNCEKRGRGYSVLEMALNPNWYSYLNAAYLISKGNTVTPLAKKLLEIRQCYRCKSSEDPQCEICEQLVKCTRCDGSFKQSETYPTRCGIKCLQCYTCSNRLCSSDYSARKPGLCVKCITKYSICEVCNTCMEGDSICYKCNAKKNMP